MPEFVCVQCFTCNTFQVQQVKKTAKFNCRMCQAVQYVSKVYAVSAQAKDIRFVVTELNAKRGDSEQHSAQPLLARPRACVQHSTGAAAESDQWSKFLSKENDSHIQDLQGVDGSSDDYVTCLPDQWQRKRKQPSQLDDTGEKHKLPLGQTAASKQHQQKVLKPAPGLQDSVSACRNLQHPAKLHQQPQYGTICAPVLGAEHQHGGPQVSSTRAAYSSAHESSMPGTLASVQTRTNSSCQSKVQTPSQHIAVQGSTWSTFLCQEDQMPHQDLLELYDDGTDFVTSIG